MKLNLNDTVELMNSSDYRDRFVAEYIQLKIRHEKLKDFNTRIEAAVRTAGRDNGVDEPVHDCPAGLLREQQAAMGEYLHLLEVRAKIEDIDLEDVMLYLEAQKIKSRVCNAPCCAREAAPPAAAGRLDLSLSAIKENSFKGE